MRHMQLEPEAFPSKYKRMKRSEKIALSLAVTAVAAATVYLVSTTLARSEREAAMARLLASPPNHPTTTQDASKEVSSPQPAPARAGQHVDKYAFRNILREHRSMLTDWALEDYIKAWRRNAFEFADADWLEGAKFVTRYQEPIDVMTAALVEHVPTVGFEFSDGSTFELLGCLMLIDAEVSFRNGDDERGFQRLVTMPLTFSDACDAMNRVLPNPVPDRYIDPLLQRLNEFDPQQNEVKRIVHFAQQHAEQWAQGLAASGWLQEPSQRGERLLQELFLDGPKSAMYRSPLGRAMVDRDIATFLDLQSQLRDAVLMPYTDGLAVAEAIDRDVTALSDESYYLVRSSYIRAAQCIERVARETVRLDLPQLGILIERYHADHRAFPGSLHAIADRLPNGLPIDPFSGNDYVYRITRDDFLLYSIGPNQTDDNANPNEGLDLVWRQRSD